MWKNFLFFLMLLPYDGMHVLPSGSYRPIIIYGFVIYIVFNLKTVFVIKKEDRRLLLFFIFTSMITVIIKASKNNTGGLYSVLNYISPIIIGYISFVAMNDAFKKRVEAVGTSEFTDELFAVIAKAYYFPIIIGILEILSLIGILPYTIKLFFMRVFGGIQTSRLCITTTEASWAATHMIIAIATYIYCIKRWPRKKKYKIAMILSALLFFCIMSLQGIGIVVIGGIVYSLLLGYSNNCIKMIIKKMLKVAVIILVGWVLVITALKIFGTGTYYGDRILNYTNLYALVSTDSSSYIRIINPFIGLIMCMHSPICGIGGNEFEYLYGEYVSKYTPWAKSLPEVAGNMIYNNANILNLYIRVIVDSGLIGMSLFFSFFFGIIKKIKVITVNIPKKNFILWVAMILTIPLQFGSYAYVPFYLALAAINAISIKNSII